MKKRELLIIAGVLVPFALLVIAGLYFSPDAPPLPAERGEGRGEGPTSMDAGTRPSPQVTKIAPHPDPLPAPQGEGIPKDLEAPLAAVRSEVKRCFADQHFKTRHEVKVRFTPTRDGADYVQVRTDAEGRYALDLVERGEHWVVLHLPSDSLAERGVMIGDQDQYAIDLDLPGTLVRGRVVDARGAPVVAALRLRRTDVESSTGGWSTVANDNCAKDGTFVFEGLERGHQLLGARGCEQAVDNGQSVVVDDHARVRVPVRGVVGDPRVRRVTQRFEAG